MKDDPDECPLCEGSMVIEVNVASPEAPYRAIVELACMCAVNSRPGPRGQRPKEKSK